MSPPTPTLALDVYGTLIDTAGVAGELEKLLGDEDAATEFSNQWRTKQLEYTFRYGLMGRYRDFRACTHQSLDYCCESLRADFSATERDHLMACYLQLPAFSDVATGLERLSQAKVAMFAFSNGRPDDLEQLLTHAGIRAYFTAVVSVDEVSTFKPNPAVYHHFLARAGVAAEDAWLISANPFDICGARAVGMRALWLRRNPAVAFDPWEFTPTAEAATFTEMAQHFTAGAMA